MTSTPPLLTAALLFGGILPLIAGPLLAQWAERSRATKTALDAFIAVTLAGIVVLHLWPHAFMVAGGWALVGGLAGLLLPFLLHGPLHSQEQKIYPTMLALVFLGLTLHATLDGVALLSPLLSETDLEPYHSKVVEAEDHEDHRDHEHGESQAHGHSHAHGSKSEAKDETAPSTEGHGAASHDHAQESAALLALAVILHRLPMGLAVWWLTVPLLGRRAAVFLLATLAAATVLGFVVAGQMLTLLSIPSIAIFEATVAGMLLHVVAGHEHSHGAHDHHHGHEHHHHGHRHDPADDVPIASALGALLGGLLLVALSQVHPMEQSLPEELSFGQAFLTLGLFMAPLILLGAVFEILLPRSARPIRSILSPTPLLVSLALLGWQWTLLCFTAALWVTIWAFPKAGRETNSRPSDGSFWAQLQRWVHRNGLWALAGVGVVALMEPIIRFDPSTTFEHPWLSTGFTLSVAAVVGLLCRRHALLGVPLAFFLLHLGWPPFAVACFLLSGICARSLQLDTTLQRSAPVFLALVAWIWIARFLPTTAAADFHQLAGFAPALWQLAAAGVFGICLISGLFRLGFRGFLSPVFGLGTELTFEIDPDRHPQEAEARSMAQP